MRNVDRNTVLRTPFVLFTTTTMLPVLFRALASGQHFPLMALLLALPLAILLRRFAPGGFRGLLFLIHEVWHWGAARACGVPASLTPSGTSVVFPAVSLRLFLFIALAPAGVFLLLLIPLALWGQWGWAYVLGVCLWMGSARDMAYAWTAWRSRARWVAYDGRYLTLWSAEDTPRPA